MQRERQNVDTIWRRAMERATTVRIGGRSAEKDVVGIYLLVSANNNANGDGGDGLQVGMESGTELCAVGMGGCWGGGVRVLLPVLGSAPNKGLLPTNTKAVRREQKWILRCHQ